MQTIYQNLQQGEDIRKNLIELKKMLKEEGAYDTYLSMTEDDELIASFLKDEDPKVRKNAAQILGIIQSQESIGKLWEAYEAEEQLFVKSAYVEAMQELDCRDYADRLRARCETLMQTTPQEEEKKHVQEELTQIRKLLRRFDGSVRHRFTGYGISQDFILTTMPDFQETTEVQIGTGKTKRLSIGVLVRGGDLNEALKIRTFRELLFPLECGKNLTAKPGEIAEAIASCGVVERLLMLHEGDVPFQFRLELKGNMSLEHKSIFAKRLAAEIELQTRHRLLNSTDDYEVEFRFIQNRAGGFFPCMKLFTIPMRRFSYRKYTTATSMHPSLAALLVELAGNYLAPHAYVLDAFCGTGTLLTERMYSLSVRAAYGTDTFGDAILGARENARIARMDIHYVHRDYFGFTHECPFDEIWAGMPRRGKKNRGEMDAFYQSFFKKAQELLNVRGRVFLYCDENGLVKKHIRINGHFKLKQEFVIREKEGDTLYILEYSG